MQATTVQGYLSQPVISIATDQSVYEAFDFLLEHHVRHLVVVDVDGHLQGTDTLKAAEFDAVIVHQNFRVVFANEAARKLFSFATLKETLGRNMLDYIPAHYRKLAERFVRSTARQGHAFDRIEMEALHPHTGDIFPIEMANTMVQWDNQPAVVSIVRDISERQQIKQMRLLESAVGSVNESIIITDTDGTIVYVNPAFTVNTGFEPEDAIGKAPAILNSKQQSKSFYNTFWRKILDGEPWSGRILDRKKDGTIFPVYLSVAPIFNGHGEISPSWRQHD